MIKSAEFSKALKLVAITLSSLACSPDFLSKRSNPPDSVNSDLEGKKLLLTLPIKSVGPFTPGLWSFQKSDQNIMQGDPNKWLGLDENQVFLKQLSHVQDKSNWTMKVGKGGQIYSISTPETGEMVAIQRKTHGQWMDEVFQHAIPSYLYQKDSSLTVVDGDIHQAGYYTMSDLDPKVQILPKSVYSPTFPPTQLEFINAENSYAFTTWPQHAHLPRRYTENGMLMEQMIRDLGDGVIEVTLLINKWQGTETRDINLPWSAWRPQNLPSVLLSNPDGSYTESNQPFAQDPALLKEGKGMRSLYKANTPNRSPNTGGWIAVAQSNQNTSIGIGIVFGKHASAIEGNASYLRWGNYSIGRPEEGTVVTVKRNIPLMPGDSVYARYFLVIGPVSKIQYYGNLLESQVEIGRIDKNETKSGNICIARDEVLKIRRGCPENSVPLFLSFRDFQPNSQPLFTVERDNGTQILTNNPYEISFDPTDGKTISYRFLGWALPKADLPSVPSLKLSDLPAINGLEINKEVQTLYVRSVK